MALVDLARRVSASVAAAALFTAPSFAADTAQFDAIGYSEDGRHFAFEQFGIQDGSGFPYSDIFVIDLNTDSFVAGAPFRARIDTDGAQLTDARAQAASMADAALDELGISRPALPIVLRGDGETDDGLKISYGIPTYGLAAAEGDYELTLAIFHAPSTQNCELFEGEPMGYGILRETDGERVELYKDTHVPASRNCVTTYKFYGVFNPFNAFDDSSAVAVISVWSHGFEGYDRRFVALPVGDR